MMKVRSVLLAVCLLGMVSAAAAGPAPAAKERWLADYAALKRALEERSPNLAWLGSPQSGVDLPALDRRTTAALAMAQTEDDAREAIRSFVRGLKDGHLSELPALAPAGQAPLDLEPPAFDADDPQTGCAVLGFEADGRTGFSLPFHRSRGFKLIEDGLDRPFRTALVPLPGGAGEAAIVRIQQFFPSAFPAVCHEAWADLRQRGQDFGWRDVRAAAQQRWLADLAGRLKDLAKRGVRVLIVDIGDNSGGNDSGDWTARMLAERELVSSRVLVTTSADGLAFLDGEIEGLQKVEASAKGAERRLVKGLREAYQASRAGAVAKACDLSWVWQEQRPWNPAGCNRLAPAGFASGPVAQRPIEPLSAEAAATVFWPSQAAAYRGAWTGPVYVLADAKTYSAAEMFAAIVQDNGVGKLVGTRTGGDGCGFLGPLTPLVLESVALRFRIPNCIRLRRDGANEVAGVAPDLPILPTEGESDPARAARAIAAIAKDAAGRD